MSDATREKSPLQPITDAVTRGRYIKPLAPGHIALNTLDQVARRMRILCCACEGDDERVNPQDVVDELLALSDLCSGATEAVEAMTGLAKAS